MSEAPGTREDLVAFLNTVAKVGCEVEGVDDHANLVDEGIMDSLALVEVVAWLENRKATGWIDFEPSTGTYSLGCAWPPIANRAYALDV